MYKLYPVITIAIRKRVQCEINSTSLKKTLKGWDMLRERQWRTKGNLVPVARPFGFVNQS